MCLWEFQFMIRVSLFVLELLRVEMEKQKNESRDYLSCKSSEVVRC